MKKILSALFVFAALFTACTKELETQVADLEKRVDKIEVDLKAAIAAIEEATEKGYYISSYQLSSDGAYYTLTFTNGKAITITNGKDGAKGDKGDTGAKGDKGDKGDTGDAYFKSVKVTDTSVIIELVDGTKFTLPLEKAFALDINTDLIRIKNTESATIPYKVVNANENTVVDCFTSGLYSAVVNATSASAGNVEITAPEIDSNGRILVYADNGQGKTSIKSINLVNKSVFEVEQIVSGNGGELELSVTHNVACEAVFTADWIHIAPAAKADVVTTVKIVVDENTGMDPREAKVEFKAGGVTIQSFIIAQKGAAGIRNYKELLAFRDAVNEEEGAQPVSDFKDKDGVVKLLADIDFAEAGTITDWKPIANIDLAATSTNLGSLYGWTGVFDGQNHVIKNLVISQEGQRAWSGFFGGIDGGTVKNIVFDETCSITIKERSLARGSIFGGVVSHMQGGTLENVVFKGKVSLNHKTSAGFNCFGALVGAASCFKMDTKIINCKFEGEMTGKALTNSSTTNAPRMGAVVGEIRRVTLASSDYMPSDETLRVYVTGCEVSGKITTEGIRTGGITGQITDGAIIDNCKFTGVLVNDATNFNAGTSNFGSARIGGIVGYEDSKNFPAEIKNCTIEGTVVDLTQGQVGGLAGFVRYAKFSDCTVNANVASVFNAEWDKSYYKGIVFGQINNVKATYSNIKGKGNLGDGYDGAAITNPVAVTAENAATMLVGFAKDGVDATGITFWN